MLPGRNASIEEQAVNGATVPRLIAASVVRGSQQGERHGGVYTVDFAQQVGALRLDWNTAAIDWEGRGADRGSRGIAFDGDDTYIAASGELLVYDPDFSLLRSFRNRSLIRQYGLQYLDQLAEMSLIVAPQVNRA